MDRTIRNPNPISDRSYYCKQEMKEVGISELTEMKDAGFLKLLGCFPSYDTEQN